MRSVGITPGNIEGDLGTADDLDADLEAPDITEPAGDETPPGAETPPGT